MKRIILIEDDMDLRDELTTLLTANGYEVTALTDFTNVCRDIIDSRADLALLDIVLPCLDGQAVLQSLRKSCDVPVIMVTSKNTEMDEVLCMSLGADDFISKPFNPTLLLLHIEAVFKRINQTSKIICFNDLTLDTDKGILSSGDVYVELSKNEFKILLFLLRNKGRIVSRDELLSFLWEQEAFVDDNTLTVNISRVRKRLEDIGHGNIIHTKRGMGYIIYE